MCVCVCVCVCVCLSVCVRVCVGRGRRLISDLIFRGGGGGEGLGTRFLSNYNFENHLPRVG